MFSQINVRTKSQSPGTYTVNHTCYEVYKDDIKFKTQSRQKTQKPQENQTVVFQKNRYKILTYINPFEQNNDHTRMSHEIEFRSSFNYHIMV